MSYSTDLPCAEPGGYIQWDEADFGGIYLKTPTKEVSCAALDEVKHRVHDALLASKGTNFRYLAQQSYFPLAEADKSSWVRELCHVFQARQLKVLDDKFLPIEDDIAVPWTLQHLMAIVEFIQTIDRPVGSAVDWWELYHRVIQDIRNGASMRMSMVSILGQMKSHWWGRTVEKRKVLRRIHACGLDFSPPGVSFRSSDIMA